MEKRTRTPSRGMRNSVTRSLGEGNKRRRIAPPLQNAGGAAARNIQQVNRPRTREAMLKAFALDTLEPSASIPAHHHVNFPGKGWQDESQPPSGHIARTLGGQGAWRCKRQHTHGNYYNASGRGSCGGCGGARDFENEMKWDLHYDKSRRSGYMIFHKNTGFVPTLATKTFEHSREAGRHQNGKSCRMRILLRRAFPEFSSEDLRPYWSRPFEWTQEGTKEVETLMKAIQQEIKDGTWTDDATTPSSVSDLSEDEEQDDDEGEECEIEEEDQEEEYHPRGKPASRRHKARNNNTNTLPIRGTGSGSCQTNISHTKRSTNTTGQGLNTHEEPEDDDEEITMKEEPIQEMVPAIPQYSPPVLSDHLYAIMGARQRKEFEERSAEQRAEFEERCTRERREFEDESARERTKFEDYITALERKHEYRTMVDVPEDARLLRFLIALFSYNAQINDPERPEVDTFPIRRYWVDRVRGLVEEVGTGSLEALVEVVVEEAGYEGETLRRSLKRRSNKS